MATSLLDDISDYIDDHLRFNPSRNVPYHNNRHMTVVWDIARNIWTEEKLLVDSLKSHNVNVTSRLCSSLGDEWSLIALMIASKLHDWGHSAGKGPDSDNVMRAIEKAKEVMAGYPIEISDRVKETVISAIASTQYPFVIDPKNRIEKILRDADLLYTAVMDDPLIVMENLRKEMEVMLGRSINYHEMCHGQREFLTSARLFTISGQKLWDKLSGPFFTKLEEYAAARVDDTPTKVEILIDTCDMGHKFAKFPDHPKKDGIARCPYCLAIGLDTIRNYVNGK